MSRLFLTNIDLNTNELQNAVIQNLSSAPSSGNKEGRIYYDSTTHVLRYYGANGAWYNLAAGGTAASTVTLTGDVTGTANVDPATGIITLSTTIDSSFATKYYTDNAASTAQSNSESYTDSAISTEVTNRNSAIATAKSESESYTDGRITSEVSDRNDAIATALSTAESYTDSSISTEVSNRNTAITNAINSATTSIESYADTAASTAQSNSEAYTDNKFTNFTDPTFNSVTVTNNVTVNGDLDVKGTLTAVNKQEIDISDNTIVLNSNFTSGSPSQDAAIQVKRGSANTVGIVWSEGNQDWTITNDGNNYFAVARKAVFTIGDSSNTSFDVVHNLGTQDITVAVRMNNADYELVETDVKMKDANTVTIAFTDAPALNAYKVIIVG